MKSVKRSMFAGVAGVVVLGLASQSLAQHAGDLLLSIAGGKMQVNQYVFTEQFGGTAAAGYGTSDPGFNSIASQPLLANTSLNFTIVAPTQTNRRLSYWSGTGPVSFIAPPSDEAILLNRSIGPGLRYDAVADNSVGDIFGWQRVVNTSISTTTPTSGLGGSLDVTSSSGVLHRHIGFALRGNDKLLYDYAPVPSDGIYLLALSLSQPTLTPSDPVYFLFGRGVSDAALTSAAQFVQTTYVPEPASFAAIGLGMMALLKRRRRA